MCTHGRTAVRTAVALQGGTPSCHAAARSRPRLRIPLCACRERGGGGYGDRGGGYGGGGGGGYGGGGGGSRGFGGGRWETKEEKDPFAER